MSSCLLNDFSGFISFKSFQKLSEDNRLDDYEYALVLHTKSNTEWRKQLFYTVFNFPIERWETLYPKAGIIGSKKWCLTMHPGRSEYELHRYNLTELGLLEVNIFLGFYIQIDDIMIV